MRRRRRRAPAGDHRKIDEVEGPEEMREIEGSERRSHLRLAVGTEALILLVRIVIHQLYSDHARLHTQFQTQYI